MNLKGILSLSAVVLASVVPTIASADVGEVMGGSHLPPKQTTVVKKNVQWKSDTNDNFGKQTNYYEDNQSMTTATTATTPITYNREFQTYDYLGNQVYYGYYDDYGYWHNYTDDWGNRMYNWNGYYYYY